MSISRIFVAAAACAALAVTASAQQTKPTGISVKIGKFMPSSGIARAAGKSWTSFGLEYKLGDMKFMQDGTNLSYSISADTYSTGGFRATPVLFNITARRMQFYGVAGIGAAFTKSFHTGAFSNSTEIGYQLGIGYEYQKLSIPVFAELRYFGSTESQLTGWNIGIGVRF